MSIELEMQLGKQMEQQSANDLPRCFLANGSQSLNQSITLLFILYVSDWFPSCILACYTIVLLNKCIKEEGQTFTLYISLLLSTMEIAAAKAHVHH